MGRNAVEIAAKNRILSQNSLIGLGKIAQDVFENLLNKQ